jgi:hypothetical protein
MNPLEELSRMEHGLLITIGSGKQGKSCALHTIVWLCWPDRPVYLLDNMQYDISMFPGYRLVNDPDAIPPGSIVVIEDVNRVFHSRGSGKDATLQRWLGVISHKSIIVCISTQNMAGTDVEFLRSQDAVMLLKYMHWEDLEYERPELRMNQAFANTWIEKMTELRPEIDRKAWSFFPRWNKLVALPMVPWWSYANSHMLREAKVCQ